MKITDNDNYEIGRFRSESSKKGPVYPSLKPDYDNEAMLKSFGLDWTRLRQSISEAFLPSVFSLECLAASVGSIDPVPVSQREVWVHSGLSAFICFYTKLSTYRMISK